MDNLLCCGKLRKPNRELAALALVRSCGQSLVLRQTCVSRKPNRAFSCTRTSLVVWAAAKITSCWVGTLVRRKLNRDLVPQTTFHYFCLSRLVGNSAPALVCRQLWGLLGDLGRSTCPCTSRLGEGHSNLLSHRSRDNVPREQ